MLVEYALGTGGLNYGLLGEVLAGRGPYPLAQWRDPIRVTRALPLSKLHGSVSWDEGGRYTDGRRALTGHALIVAPTPEKSPPASLADTWAVAAATLASATALVVFGFAFNPYDEALLDLLGTAGRHLSSVVLVDIRPQAERASALWPNAVVASCAPPPEGDADLTKWLSAPPGLAPRPPLRDSA